LPTGCCCCSDSSRSWKMASSPPANLLARAWKHKAAT
jgi:hypothetical protein